LQKTHFSEKEECAGMIDLNITMFEIHDYIELIREVNIRKEDLVFSDA
jgi:hypothetical protein